MDGSAFSTVKTCCRHCKMKSKKNVVGRTMGNLCMQYFLGCGKKHAFKRGQQKSLGPAASKILLCRRRGGGKCGDKLHDDWKKKETGNCEKFPEFDALKRIKKSEPNSHTLWQYRLILSKQPHWWNTQLNAVAPTEASASEYLLTQKKIDIYFKVNSAIQSVCLIGTDTWARTGAENTQGTDAGGGLVGSCTSLNGLPAQRALPRPLLYALQAELKGGNKWHNLAKQQICKISGASKLRCFRVGIFSR